MEFPNKEKIGNTYNLIKRGINTLNEQGKTPLIAALDNKQFSEAARIISMGADLNACDEFGRHPLDLIRETNNTEVIIAAFNHGIDISTMISPANLTLDFIAAHPKLMDLISCNKIDTNSLPSETLAAINAASSNNIDALSSYIENGGDINLSDKNGNTLLMHAATNISPEALKYLISRGADINAKNNNGQTAVMLSAQKGIVENIEILATNNADLNIQDNDGNTASMYAAANNNIKALEKLSEYDADVTITNNEEQNILMVAIQNNNIEMAEYILDNFVENPNERNNEQEEVNEPSIFKEEINSGTTHLHQVNQEEISEPNIFKEEINSDTTHLHQANQEEISEPNIFKEEINSDTTHLHQHEQEETSFKTKTYSHSVKNTPKKSKPKININARDKHGRTALHYAIETKQFKLAEKLIQHGADKYLEDENGMSAFNILKQLKQEIQQQKTQQFSLTHKNNTYNH